MPYVKIAIAIAVACATALPAASAERRPNDPAGERFEAPAGKVNPPDKYLSLEGVQAASIGNARVGLVFDAFGSKILRRKGVEYVRKPGGAVGLYCIRPNNMSKKTVRRLVPLVTVEYSNSVDDGEKAYFAYYRDSACKATEIGVQTRRIDGNDIFNTDLVGFNLIVN